MRCSPEGTGLNTLYQDARYSIKSLVLARERLFFLRGPVGGSHFNAMDLCSVGPEGGGVELHLLGLFCEQLHSIDGERVIFDCYRGASKVIQIFDGQRRSCLGEGCSTYLDHFKGVLIWKSSSPTQPAGLVIGSEEDGGSLAAGGCAVRVELGCLDYDSDMREFLSSCYHQVIPWRERPGEWDQVSGALETANMVLVGPPPRSKDHHQRRLVVIPHGGPNSVYPGDYRLLMAVLLWHGFSVLQVNYTGSIGFGQEGVGALEGQIGKTDVDDVLYALERVAGEEAAAAAAPFDRIYLVGGSHGGYIGAMLTARPDCAERLAACVLLNPVIDLHGMTMASDIDDWAFGQLGLNNDLGRPRPPDQGELIKMREHSPSGWLGDHVRCPTLIMVGERDLRVPPFQGKMWHRWLQALGVESRLLCFPDADHSLDSPTSELVTLRSTIEFLLNHS